MSGYSSSPRASSSEHSVGRATLHWYLGQVRRPVKEGPRMTEAVATEQHSTVQSVERQQAGLQNRRSEESAPRLVLEFNRLIESTRREYNDALEQAVAARDK